MSQYQNLLMNEEDKRYFAKSFFEIDEDSLNFHFLINCFGNSVKILSDLADFVIYISVLNFALDYRNYFMLT